MNDFILTHNHEGVPIPYLYKYMEEKWAKQMLENGNIRLGTLYEYRTHWNDQVQDTEEGKYNLWQHVQQAEVREGDNLGLVSELIQHIGPGSTKLTDVRIGKAVTIPNRHIYCATYKASKEVMQSFNAETCIEIFDSEGFIDAVVNELLRQGYPLTKQVTTFCFYEGRHANYTQPSADGLPIGYWLKSPSYKSQEECRTVFVMDKEPGIDDAIIIDVPEIKKFIRRYDFG